MKYKITHTYISNTGKIPRNTLVVIIHEWVNKVIIQEVNTTRYHIIHPFDSNNQFPLEKVL